MTDNRTTELLCKLLDERGVEYKTHDIIGSKAVTWRGSVCNWVALPGEMGLAVAVYKDYLTPEQAIAATLRSDSLTAEQVRGALLLHLPHREYYGIAQTDAWQAIADASAVNASMIVASSVARLLVIRSPPSRIPRNESALSCRC